MDEIVAKATDRKFLQTAMEIGGQYAINVLTKAAASVPDVSENPAPLAFVSSLDDSSVGITVHIWTKGSNYPAIIGDLTRAYKLALDKAGISIPFPQRVIHQAKP